MSENASTSFDLPAFGVWTTQAHRACWAAFQEWFGTADTCILESLWSIESLAEKRKMREIRACVKTKNDWRENHAVLVINIMRRKAAQLNTAFSTNKWTPRRVSMILSTQNKPTKGDEQSARPTRGERL